MKTLSRMALGKYWLFGSLCLVIPATIYTGLFIEILPTLQIEMWALSGVWVFVALANLAPKWSNRIVGWMDLSFGGAFLILDIVFIAALSQQLMLAKFLIPVFAFLGLIIVYIIIGMVFGYVLSRRKEESKTTTMKVKRTLMVSLVIYLIVLGAFSGGFAGFLNVRATQLDAKGTAFRIENQAVHDAIDLQFNQYDVVVNGIKWHYVQAGNPSGTAVLFLHGLPECWYSWRYVLPLMNQSFRLIALDMKGYGRSDTTDDSYDWKVICQEIVDLMSNLAINKFYVVGHDWGALMGTKLVEDHPDRILGFVRMQGGPIQTGKANLANHPQFILFTSARMGTLFMQDAEWFINLVYPSRMLKPFGGEDQMYFTYEFSRTGVAESVPKYFSSQNQQYIPDMNNRLINQTWSFPILLLQADQDPAQPKSYFDGLSTIAPQLSLRWITNASHFDNLDQPEQVANAINSFIG